MEEFVNADSRAAVARFIRVVDTRGASHSTVAFRTRRPPIHDHIHSDAASHTSHNSPLHTGTVPPRITDSKTTRSAGAIQMSIVVTELTVPSDAFTLGQILQNHGDVHIELTQFVPTGESFVPYFWAEADDEAAFEASVRADDRVATLTKLDSGHGRHLYNIEWATDIDGFIAALKDHSLIVGEATGTPDQWRFRLRGPDHGTLSSFQHTLDDKNIPIEVERVWNPSDPQADVYGVTAKQREALELAFNNGYFNVPSETNLTDLAEQLDITRQSFSRRISRGLHSFLKNTIMNGH